MTLYPDFLANGYQVIEQLNQNLQGGRVTYKAIDIATKTSVIIKQFRFATTNDWNSYKAIEREIEVLQGLNHPGIPKYLNRFDPGDGLCLVQEYKDAQPLSTSRTFTPEEIKSIAVQILEILVYLQEARIPAIFHQDIKPENVLVDNNNKAYLIDFGLARIGTNTMALSSMMGGTMGFMPPEQIRNLKPTQASDLYSLGATLICLITQTDSINIGNLVDFDSNKFNFQEKVTKFSNRFIQWLEKMVEPNPTNRYPNAKKALEALNPLDVIRVPKVTFYGGNLNFIANTIGEKITKEIEFFNEVPDTRLEGKWSVKPHPSDPPHTPNNHDWIQFSPQKIKGNRGICQITVDTSQLQANQYFKREIVFISNAEWEVYALDLTVKTAIPQFNIRFPPYLSIFSTTLMIAVISGLLVKGGIWLTTKLNIEQWRINLENLIYSQYNYLILLLLFFIGLGVFVERKLEKQGIIIKILIALFCPLPGFGFGMILAMLWRVFDNLIIKPFVKNFSKKDYKKWVITLFLIPVIAVGILLGISTVIGLTPWVIKALIASSTPLVGMLLYSPFELITVKDKYRKLESKNLIES